MPEISRFYGIIITMYYNDHAPPHFHARYADQKGVIGIEDLRLIDGNLSRRTFDLVSEWARMHQEELQTEWDLARTRQPLFKIAPLD